MRAEARRQARQAALSRMGYPDYRAYLRSSSWAKVKRAYRESDLPQDCMCGETEGLQFHHMTYERVGREELTDLTPLCLRCHAMVHALESSGQMGLDFRGFIDEQRAARYERKAPPRGERWEDIHRSELLEQSYGAFDRRLRKFVKNKHMNPAARRDLLLTMIAELESAIGHARALAHDFT